MVASCCSNVSSIDGLILRWIQNSWQCYVFRSQVIIEMNIYGWNPINSVLSNRTSINTYIILLPTILHSLIFSHLFRTFQSSCIIISSGIHLAVPWLAGITFAGQIMCSAISFSVVLLGLVKNIFGFWTSSNIKEFERQQMYKIWPDMDPIIICPVVYDPPYLASNLSFFKVL